jgi:hypothetical protein
MKFTRSVKTEQRMEARILVIVDLGLRRDRILESPELDLEALAVLAADYEAAGMSCAAAGLRRRLEHYRTRPRDLSETDSRSSLDAEGEPR